jgi:hypothetical protein
MKVETMGRSLIRLTPTCHGYDLVTMSEALLLADQIRAAAWEIHLWNNRRTTYFWLGAEGCKETREAMHDT